MADERFAQSVFVFGPLGRFGRWINAIGLKQPFDKLFRAYKPRFRNEIVYVRRLVIDDPAAPTSARADFVHESIIVWVPNHPLKQPCLRSFRNWANTVIRNCPRAL